jgi:hypothetical protein
MIALQLKRIVNFPVSCIALPNWISSEIAVGERIRQLGKHNIG